MNTCELRFWTIQSIVCAALTGTILSGIGDFVVGQDPYYLVRGFLAVLTGIGVLTVVRAGALLHRAKSGANPLRHRTEAGQCLGRLKRYVGLSVNIGMVGTVLGLMMAFASIEPDQIQDVDQVGPVVAGLLNGVGLALSTTLAGLLVAQWIRSSLNCAGDRI